MFSEFCKFCRALHGARGYTFEVGKLDGEAASQYYEEWNSKIRTLVPKERLLDFRVEEGWPPLCAFLGVPVPDVPFPRINDKTAMSVAIKVIRCASYLFMASPLLLLYVAYKCLGHSSTKAKSN